MMKFIKTLKPIFAFVAIAMFMASCSDDNDEIAVEPGTEFDAELFVASSGSDNRDVTIDAASITNANALVKVSFG